MKSGEPRDFPSSAGANIPGHRRTEAGGRRRTEAGDAVGPRPGTPSDRFKTEADNIHRSTMKLYIFVEFRELYKDVKFDSGVHASSSATGGGKFRSNPALAATDMGPCGSLACCSLGPALGDPGGVAVREGFEPSVAFATLA
jgi:hypothetical protein